MSRPPVQPIDRESPFGIEELFFSTTDAAGVIRFGNDVFVRVSRYDAAELIGSPHNVIRHPDMPRCAFALMWETLEAGRSFVAYVKNLAKDGSYYWVCALVAPIAGGYLSIRLKPSSPLLGTVSALYAKLAAIEREVEAKEPGRKRAIEASMPVLRQGVRDLGFADYGALMAQVLLAEVTARRAALAGVPQQARGGAAPDAISGACAALHAQVDGMLGSLSAFLSLEEALVTKARFMLELGSTLELLSLNAQVRAAGLREDGATLRVVAEHVAGGARTISAAARNVAACMADVTAALKDAAFHIAASDLSLEMTSSFVRELSGGAGDAARAHVPCLAEVVGASLRRATELTVEADRQVVRLDRVLGPFLRQTQRLEIVQLTGKMEAVRCSNGALVSSIFEQVRAGAREARDELTGLVDLLHKARVPAPDCQEMDADLRRLAA